MKNWSVVIPELLFSVDFLIISFVVVVVMFSFRVYCRFPMVEASVANGEVLFVVVVLGTLNSCHDWRLMSRDLNRA